VTSGLAKYSILALVGPWLVASSTPGNVSRPFVLFTVSHSRIGGRSGTVPGFATGALMCGLLQWAFNEFDILRINHVSREAQPPPVSTISAVPSRPIEIPPPSIPVTAPESPRSLTDRIFSMFGHKISDEEYLDRIKAQRDGHLRRIEQLERERGGKRET